MPTTPLTNRPSEITGTATVISKVFLSAVLIICPLVRVGDESLFPSISECGRNPHH